MSRKERQLQGITRENSYFPKIIISEMFFVSNNFVSEGRVQKLNANFIFSSFSGAPGICRQKKKSQGIPPKSLVSLGFEGHTELFGPTYRTFWPPPLHVEDHIWTKKFGFGFPFLP